MKVVNKKTASAVAVESVVRKAKASASRAAQAAPHEDTEVHAADTQAFSGFFSEVDGMLEMLGNLSWQRVMIATLAFIGGAALGSYGVYTVVNLLLAGAIALSTPAWLGFAIAVLVALIGARMVVRGSAKLAAKIIAGAFDQPVQEAGQRSRSFLSMLNPFAQRAQA